MTDGDSERRRLGVFQAPSRSQGNLGQRSLGSTTNSGATGEAEKKKISYHND